MQGLTEIIRANIPADNAKRREDLYRVQRDVLVTTLIQICNDPEDALKLALAALDAQGIKPGNKHLKKAG